MSTDMAIQKTLQRALRDKMQRRVDAKGYVRTPAENLIDGVIMEQFEDDLRGGDGDELRMKFCAVHSSAALAVNCFAWFKNNDRLRSLSLLGTTGANALNFERPFPIFRGGRPANLDVWIERDYENIAIESKLTEHLVKRRAEFSEAYERLAPKGLAEPCWWEVYQQAKKETKSCYLDKAQLIKHYFGLRKYKQSPACTKQLVFLYLYWEPLNWQGVRVCTEHRKELDELADWVRDSDITFKVMTYAQLWKSWSEVPALAQHTKNLKARYEVMLAHRS